MRIQAKKHLLAAIAIGLISLGSPAVSFADGIPMTNPDGTINCANPDNAITTTCRGEAPPPPVNTPSVPTDNVGGNGSSGSSDCSVEANKNLARCLPMTNSDGSINCAQPDNAITTTCWAQSQSGNSVDCTILQYKDYPACTGVKPQSVIDYENSRKSATEISSGNVDCLDPMLSLTSACTNRTTTTLPTDCVELFNKSLPRCQPMTLPDGKINCAQPDNAITTTCWALFQTAGKSSSKAIALTGIDCSNNAYKAYPLCTGIAPHAVLVENQAKSNMADTSPKEDSSVTSGLDLVSMKSKSTTIKLNLEGSKIKAKLILTKKGSPTITQTLTTDSQGDKMVKFTRNLSGYTIKVVVDGKTVDKLTL